MPVFRFKRHAIAAAVALSCSLSMGAFADAANPKAYVSNQDGGVSIIDLTNMHTIGFFDIQAKGPRGIGITPDGKWLVTANKDNGNISVIDTATGTIVRQTPIGKNPEFVRVNGFTAYVTYEPSPSTGAPPRPGAPEAKEDDDDDKLPGHIAIVDLKTGRIIHDITGKPETEGMEFSPDGKWLVVTNESDNSISVHDLKTGKLLKSIAVSKYGERPRGIKVSPDGKMYVVTLELSNKLLVLDSKLNPLKTIETGQSPYGVAFDSTGQRIFVAASREGTLQVFDAKTLEKIKDVPTGKRCWHFSFTPDNQKLVLACGKSSELVVVDADKLEVSNRIAAPDTPWGIVAYPKAMGSLDKP